jgi:hypothetical protein
MALDVTDPPHLFKLKESNHLKRIMDIICVDWVFEKQYIFIYYKSQRIYARTNGHIKRVTLTAQELSSMVY